MTIFKAEVTTCYACVEEKHEADLKAAESHHPEWRHTEEGGQKGNVKKEYLEVWNRAWAESYKGSPKVPCITLADNGASISVCRKHLDQAIEALRAHGSL